jgi:hypothetical protein
MINRPIPPPGSPAARGFRADLVAEADCLRQLGCMQPDGCFQLPYLYHRRWSTPHYESRLLQFRDIAEGIYYDDFRLRYGDSRKRLEESARKRLPPGLERLLEWDYIFGWVEPEETYPRVIRHLLESGFLDRYPELRGQAEAALTLGGLL